MEPRRPSIVVLIGFMGAGKTSAGRALAQRLGWEFVDLDDRIVARERHNIAEIFREQGEAAFRAIETQILRETLEEQPGRPRVLALGGGAFPRAENRALLRQFKVPAIFLDAPIEELYRRCRIPGAERPLARDMNQFRQLYEQRLPAYMEADVRLQTDGKSVAQVACEAAERLGWEGQ